MNADTTDRWLSEGAEALVQQLETAGDGALHCDVLVVGSGYGGAVAAARLAGATRTDGTPATVFLLERGREHLPGEFPASFAELPGHVRFGLQDGGAARGRRDGLFDMRIGKQVHVLLGNGLGGGSLINAAVMERPTAETFADGRWPPGTGLAALAPFYERAEAMLQPRPIPETVPKLESLLAAGIAMGAPERRKAAAAVAFDAGPSAAGVALERCLRCGDCVSGCNHGAKQSLDANYLALAAAHGARLFCGATVLRLRARRPEDGGGWAVDFVFTDTRKARVDAQRPYTVNARHVVLAAGSLGSTEILLRSRGAGLACADALLGHSFSTNGDLIAVAHRQRERAPCSAREGEPPAARGIGPTITGLVRCDGGMLAKPLVFEEFAIPGPLRRLFAEVVTTAHAIDGLGRPDLSAHRTDEAGTDPQAVDDDALEHTPVYGMMGDDGAAGTLRFVGTADARHDGQIEVDKGGLDAETLFAAQLARLEAAHERPWGRGGRVLPNPLWRLLPRELPLPEAFPGQMITVHPLGGCPMGEDRTRGVVDPFGAVFAADGETRATLPGLAVLDGAIVPAALAINPALTIAALAERAVPELARRWGLTLRSGDALQTRPRPRRRDLTQPQPPRPTAISLHERMTGTLRHGGADWQVAATVRFASVDLPSLRALPRVWPQDHIELAGTDAGGRTFALRCTGHAKVLVREASDAFERSQRSLGPVLRRLAAFADGAGDGSLLPLLLAACTHFGGVRRIEYEWTVADAAAGAPFAAGDRLRLVKRIAFEDGANLWRQLGEGVLSVEAGGTSRTLGRLVLDPAYFVEQNVALLAIDRQQDAPNALGDLAELALFVLRTVLRIHLPSLLPPLGPSPKAESRLPADLGQGSFTFTELPAAGKQGGAGLRIRLSRYRPEAPRAGARPVLLIHGLGASGSTFAHPKIGGNLVEALIAAGRDAWVLDLRTSIGLAQTGHPWTFEEIAENDIPQAIDHVRGTIQAETGQAPKVDVVAHCIGAAMFAVAVLGSDTLPTKIGCVVLSQVGPLLRLTAFNRLRGLLAAWLQQFLAVERFDASPAKPSLLVDALLATFPYPDDDGEAERLARVPDFVTAVRHRADAIFGQTMLLPNVGDALLPHLADLYGGVEVRTLAQTIHYAREQLLTDAGGLNQLVALHNLRDRFHFPVLLLHGQRNAVFDWRGSYDTWWLLQQAFVPGTPMQAPKPPQGAGDLHLAGGRHRLHVLARYGHQDMLIGARAHAEVFPLITRFLDDFATLPPPTASRDAGLVALRPWTGPWLGHVEQRAGPPTLIAGRLALRPPPARATALALVFVPARREGDGWRFLHDEAVAAETDREDLFELAVEFELFADRAPRYDGFAVLTVHDDLPFERSAVVLGRPVPDGLFAKPSSAPPSLHAERVRERLGERSAGDDEAVVQLDAAWLRATTPAGTPPQPGLTLALVSCQYPPGLFDHAPAQDALTRLAAHLVQAPAAARPQRLLAVGDQVYVDETAGLFDRGDPGDVEAAWRAAQRLPALRRVVRALPSYPMFDDHEIADDWEPPAPSPPAPPAEFVVLQQQLQKLAPAKPGSFGYSLAPAGLPMLVLDTRSARQRRTLRANPDGTPLETATILDPAAAAGLRAWLQAAPPDLPKFVVSPVAVFPFARAAVFGPESGRIALDDWGGFPASLHALLRAVLELRVRHLVLLSGDRHLSSASSLWLGPPDDPLEVVSVVSSPLYGPWPFANTRPDELHLDGPCTLRFGAASIAATMVGGFVGGGDGFAVVRVASDAGGGWTLEVEFDLRDGRHRRRRRLGDAADRRWAPA